MFSGEQEDGPHAGDHNVVLLRKEKSNSKESHSIAASPRRSGEKYR